LLADFCAGLKRACVQKSAGLRGAGCWLNFISTRIWRGQQSWVLAYLSQHHHYFTLFFASTATYDMAQTSTIFNLSQHFSLF
jgi:hypothetical protein